MRQPQRIYGIIATVAFHLILLLLLCRGMLVYPPDDATTWPPQPEEMIEARELEPLYQAGELVRLGDNLATPTPDDMPAPSAVDSPEPTQPGIDPADNGHAGKPDPAITQKQPSPAQVNQPQKGPVKPKTDTDNKKQEARRQEQARKTADDATRRAFSRDKSANGSGQAGQPGGTPDKGSYTGTPGNGTGRSIEHWGAVKSTRPGTIAIRVTVDSQGKVTSARYTATGSTGAAAADVAMRRRCEQAARDCQFARAEGSKPASGIIYWTFR